MSAGISRVHGYAAAPSQRPSTVSFFTITFPANIKTTATATTTARATNGDGSLTGYATVSGSDLGVTNGALDQIFRVAVDQFATVAMIGTVASNGLSVRFAIEDTGADVNSASGLGLGNGSAAHASTQEALEGAVRALGTVNGIVLSTGTTVAAFAL
jgi:hypothetical protein